ncbi:MAG: hypothetical protein WD750_04660 [Gammaproteobacteria bacterium]
MPAAAIAILKAYFRICLFRGEPREMPAATAFLVFSAGLYTLAGMLLVLVYQSLSAAVLSALLETALLLGVIWLLLAAFRLQSRFNQTASALTGSGFLFSLFSLPLFLLRPWEGDAGGSPLLALVSLALLFLFGWNIAVIGHILRHALSTRFAAGILLAIGYVWLITAALGFFIPETLT